MPQFRLRSWMEQTLYDCHDYLVEAATIEEAAEKLQELQDQADENDHDVKCPDGAISRIYYVGRDGKDVLVDDVRPLDPEEIVDGSSGICEIDGDGKKLRDIDPDAQEITPERIEAAIDHELKKADEIRLREAIFRARAQIEDDGSQDDSEVLLHAGLVRAMLDAIERLGVKS